MKKILSVLFIWSAFCLVSACTYHDPETERWKALAFAEAQRVDIAQKQTERAITVAQQALDQRDYWKAEAAKCKR